MLVTDSPGVFWEPHLRKVLAEPGARSRSTDCEAGRTWSEFREHRVRPGAYHLTARSFSEPLSPYLYNGNAILLSGSEKTVDFSVLALCPVDINT